MSGTTTDLVRHLSDVDPDHGIPLSQLPDELLDADLLTVLDADGLVEFGCRNHCYVGPEGPKQELRLEGGWQFRSIARSKSTKPMARFIAETLKEDTPIEIRSHVRLTNTGRIEASRLREKKPPPNRTGRRKRKAKPLTDIQQKTMEVVVECKGNLSAAARQLGKDRKTVKEAWDAACHILKKDPVTFGKPGKKKTFLRDKRGQDDVSDIDDQLQNSNDQAVGDGDPEVAEHFREEHEKQQRLYRKR